MNKTALAFVVLIVLVAGAYLLYAPTAEAPAAPTVSSETYANEMYSISFSYPGTYVLEEREVGNGERYHYAIILMDKVAAANIPQNGEGPPTINVDIFQNNLDNLTISEWIKNDSRSNFKLAFNGAFAPVSVGGYDALAYTWDGLYSGHSVVFEHGGNIVMLTVTYLSPDDAILSDFAGVMASFEPLSSVEFYGGTEE